jgi:RimJ/RimL family protein N-acetyltransferase
VVKLEGYGVELQQIGSGDIEQVRLWRNHPEVIRYMEFREYITPEMQQRWFESLSAHKDLYFMVSCAGQQIGLTNLKEINPQAKTAESGTFIADTMMQNSLIPYAAVLLLLDYGFEILGLEQIQAHVLDDNPRAIRFNKSLGFVATTVIRGGVNRLYFLVKEDYYKSTLKIRKVLNLNAPK